MDIARKLELLADAAKYDVACTSSGVDRSGKKGQLPKPAAAIASPLTAVASRC